MKMSLKNRKYIQVPHQGQSLSSTNPKQSIHFKGVLGDHNVVTIFSITQQGSTSFYCKI